MSKPYLAVLFGSILLAAIVGGAVQASPYAHLTTASALLTGISASIIGALVFVKRG